MGLVKRNPVIIEALEPRVLMSAVTLGANMQRFGFTDGDGDQVMVRLRGSGMARITLDGDAEDSADIDTIELVGTTSASRLSVRVKRGGQTTISSITGDALKKLSLRRVALDGEGIRLAQSLNRLKVAALIDGADVVLGQAGTRPLRIDVIDVISTLDDPTRIQTPGAIGRLRAKGQLDSLYVDAGGDVRRATFEGVLNDLRMRIGGKLHKLTIKRDEQSDGSLHGAVIGAVEGFGTIRVHSDIIDSLLLAGAQLDAQYTLEQAVYKAAQIKRIKVGGDVIDSVIAAGGNPGEDGLFQLHDVLAGGIINRLDIGGIVVGLNSLHPNPGIYAAELGQVKVDGINLTDLPIPQGFAAIGSAVIDPLPGAANALEIEDDGDKIGIKTILARAVARAEQLVVAATIALMDREGNLLAVLRMDGALEKIKIEAGGTGGLEAIDNVLATSLIAGTKAGTAAFLSTSRGNAFTTRTAGAIIQTHFPVDVSFQDGGPLFGVQLSSLPTSDVNRLPLGLSGDPGGLPLYRGGELIGGIGVEVDGLYTVDGSPIGGRATVEEQIALAGQIGLHPAKDIRADRIFIDGIRLDYANGKPPKLASLTDITDYDILVAMGEVDALLGPRVSPASDFTVTAITGGDAESAIIGEVPDNALADFFDGGLAFLDGDINGTEQLTGEDVEIILAQAHELNQRLRAQIRRDDPKRSQVTVSVVDHSGNLLGSFRTLDAPVFGFDVSVQKARTATFFSRSDAAAQLRDLDTMLASEIDLLQTLGAVDPTVDDPFGRHVDAVNTVGVALDGSVAMADRTSGFLSRPNLPDGIGGGSPGPFSALSPDVFSPFNTGLQTLLALPALVNFVSAFNALDEAEALAAFADGTLGSVIPAGSVSGLANGMQIFAGSVPLYKDGVLVGGVGVSGDGIEQDDIVAFAASAGFRELGGVRRADTVRIAGGLRLPYVKFPRSPFDGK